MLLKQHILDGIAEGRITLASRRLGVTCVSSHDSEYCHETTRSVHASPPKLNLGES